MMFLTLSKSAKDITGQRFHRLTAVGPVDHVYINGKPKQLIWLCRCDCAREVRVRGSHLRNGNTKSCGCLHVENAIRIGRIYRSKLVRVAKPVEYRIWEGIKLRCRGVNQAGYKNYGGRGIGIFDDWAKDFDLFFAHVGPRPSPTHSIDRIDNDRGYVPGNVRWVTRDIQANNTRRNVFATIDGETKSVSQWCRILGRPTTTVFCRIYRLGWSPEKALTTPLSRKSPRASADRRAKA